MELDALIAELDPDAIRRFRRPSMSRARAEQLLVELLADPSVSHVDDVAPGPEATLAETGLPRIGWTAPRDSGAGMPDGSLDRARRAHALKAAARRITGGHRAVTRGAPRSRDTVEHVTDPFLDQERSMNEGEPRRAPARSALLRPPSRPLPRVVVTTPPPEPAPEARTADRPAPDPTRDAMDALFTEDSTEGLVFLGQEPPTNFGAEGGTDPAMAPLPPDQTGPPEVARPTIDYDMSLPEGPQTMPELQPHGLELAGAEEPMPMDVPAPPFGFDAGERPRETRRSAPSQPPAERHAPGHLSEQVVVSSVRKLFRR